MHSEQQIRMNFENALKRAQEIEDIGNKLLSVGEDKTDQCMLGLQQGWSGYAYDSMKAKAEQVQSETIELAKKIKKAANTIRKIAKAVYDVEMDNYRLAMEREKQN